MPAIQHEFCRSFPGSGRADEDWWSLVFDPENRCLQVRHEWQASDDLDVTEFLEETGCAQTALIDRLFRVPADA
jgi:hypothetical protein